MAEASNRRIPLVAFALIAAAAHEVNRQYCAALGDTSQPAWEDAPDWQKNSAALGVQLHLSGEYGPEASHENWMRQKLAEGWTYGPVKDADKKEHPCLVSFHLLPVEQKAKDFLFRGVVHALSTPATAVDDDTVPITTVDQFAAMLAGWHTPRAARLKHMLAIPAGSEVSVTEGVLDRTVVLEGDTLTAFKAGIYNGLDELGTLPFAVSAEGEATDEEPAPAGNDAAAS